MRFMTGVAAFSGHQSMHRAAVRAALSVATAQAIVRSVKTERLPQRGRADRPADRELQGGRGDHLPLRARPAHHRHGHVRPNSDYQTAHGLLFPDFYVTMLEVIKRTSAAGLMLTPTAADFAATRRVRRDVLRRRGDGRRRARAAREARLGSRRRRLRAAPRALRALLHRRARCSSRRSTRGRPTSPRARCCSTSCSPRARRRSRSGRRPSVNA